MKKVFWIMMVAIGLSGCATMENAWEATKDAGSDAYHWAFGDDGDRSSSHK